MKRLIIIEAVLIVVILSGLMTVILLINPNYFHDYLIDKIE